MESVPKSQVNPITNEIITTRTHMITEGRYLYLISRILIPPYTIEQIVIDKFDPLLGMPHIQRITLCYNSLSSMNLSLKSLKDKKY